jgi:hypothetical protein
MAMLAACSGADGVYIEVRVPAGMTVDRVDLFLATRDCDPGDADLDCHGIVPPEIQNSSRARVEGEVFFVDDTRPFSSVPNGDGSAWFHLEPSSDVDIKTAVAVGRGAGQPGVVIFNPIDLSITQHVRVDLEPARAQQVTGNVAPAVEVWGPVQGGDYRCVAAEAQGRVVYIVPKADPDCDAVDADVECFPDVFLGADGVSSELDKQSCASFAGSLCLLGGRACDEASGMTDASCTRSDIDYCVPDHFCAACPDELGTDCFESSFAATHVKCVIELQEIVNGDGTTTRKSCGVALAPTELDASGLFDSCGEAELDIVADGFLEFAPTVTTTIGNAELVLTPRIQPGCKLGFDPVTLELDALPSSSAILSLVKVAVPSPTAGRERFLIMPLEFQFAGTPDCNQPINTRCQLLSKPNDGYVGCFQ